MAMGLIVNSAEDTQNRNQFLILKTVYYVFVFKLKPHKKVTKITFFTIVILLVMTNFKIYFLK